MDAPGGDGVELGIACLCGKWPDRILLPLYRPSGACPGHSGIHPVHPRDAGIPLCIPFLFYLIYKREKSKVAIACPFVLDSVSVFGSMEYHLSKNQK